MTQSATPPFASKQALSVLYIEDTDQDARFFERCVEESEVDASLHRERSLAAGLEALSEERPDVIVLDPSLPDSQGAETLQTVTAAAPPSLPIIVLAGEGDLETALSAQRAGTAEYLQKEELSPTLLGRTLQWVLQRSQMEARLRQRDAWIRSITENVSGGVFRVGPTGRIEYANETLVQLLGFETQDELLGKDLTSFYASPNAKGTLLAKEGPETEEIEFERRDESTFTGLLSAEAARRADGRVTHYDGFITDITERKEQEQQLRVLSAAIQQAKEAILITEADPLDEPGPRIRYVNEAFEKMTGYDEEDILGNTPRVLQGPETDRATLDSLREALVKGEEWEGESLNYRKNGEPYRVQWNVAPVRGEDGSIEYWVSVQRDVTEERRREEELRRQKSLLEQAQRLAGAWEVDLQTGEVSWSDEVYRIHELDPETEISLQEGIDFYAPEARHEARAAFERCVEEGVAFDLELPLITAKGNRRHVRTVGAPSETQDGEVVKAAGAFQDITDQKEVEKKLQKSRERLQMAVEGGNIGTWDWDVETGEVIFNRQWAEMLGYSREELDFHFNTWEELVHPQDLERAMDVLKSYIRGETDTYDPEIRMQTKSGDWKWIQTIGKVVDRDERGEATRAAGIHLDIDDRKRAEEALREREVQLRGLANSIPGVVFQAYARPERTYGFHFVSERAEEILGIPRDPEDFFERCLDRVPESEREALMEEIDETVEDTRPLSFEVPFVKPSGEQIWLVGTATPEPREDELLYNGVILDITERKRATRELEERERRHREAKEKAEEAARLKSTLLANMSHEVRTPLTSMLGFSEILTEELEGDLAGFAERIQRGSQRLIKTLNSVLELSRLEAGDYSLQRSQVRLDAIVRETVELMTPQAQEKGIDLSVEIEEPVEGYWNEGGLNRILENLVANAVKFTPVGGEVQVRVWGEDDRAALEVEDTGIGMDPDRVDTLFEPFRQESEGLDREYEGTGLGLSIVLQLVDRHEGTIEVETEKGVGTRVTVWLPIGAGRSNEE